MFGFARSDIYSKMLLGIIRKLGNKDCQQLMEPLRGSG